MIGLKIIMMKNKTAFLIIALLSSFTIFGQGKMALTKLDPTNLPAKIEYKGAIKNAVRWTDKLGDNIVITTETGEYQSKSRKENVFRDAELFAYHFIIKDDIILQTWKVYDFIKECPVEIELNFINKTFNVTDLNNDGIGEIWLMYQTVCHGDVSPSYMKVIMYQDQQKYEMSGQRKIIMADKKVYGGDYKFDKAFNDGPKIFREFAMRLWNENLMQTWE
jgi:hypothetical protein